MSCQIVHEVTQGDTGIAFADHLRIQDDSIDLSGATVDAILKTKGGTVLFESEAEILQDGTDQDKVLPNVRYIFASGDLDTIGTHDFQWKVTLANGRIVTRPPSPHQIKVVEKLSE